MWLRNANGRLKGGAVQCCNGFGSFVRYQKFGLDCGIDDAMTTAFSSVLNLIKYKLGIKHGTFKLVYPKLLTKSNKNTSSV